MSSILDKLDLRPGERRLVVGVALVVFLIINYFAVWPQFGEWSREQRRTTDAQAKYDRFKAEVDKTSSYSAELKQLEKLGGAVQSEAMSIDLQRKVQSLANLYGVMVESSSPGRGTEGAHTNAFFEERSLGMAFNSGEKELVDFLFNLVSDSAMIRAKSMVLAPDPSRMKLKGTLTLVASYQRKVPLKNVAPATTTTAKPAGQPAKTNAPPKTAPAAPKLTNQTKVATPPARTNALTRPTTAEKKK
ncbi:MAG TPA: hypothetical protein VGK40_02365 [Verrucomicrobiae bacterium]